MRDRTPFSFGAPVCFGTPLLLHSVRCSSKGTCDLQVVPATYKRHQLRKSSGASRVPRCGVERPERYDASDWAQSLLSLPKSVILRRVSGRIVPNLVVAAVVSTLYTGVAQWLPSIQTIAVSSLPHTFLATAMSLLLVFRTNAAYDRYWEGRKVWGRLLNTSRNLSRLCGEVMERDHAVVAANLIVMYCYALMHHLQGRREDEPFATMCELMSVPQELQTAVWNERRRSKTMDDINSAVLDGDGNQIPNVCVSHTVSTRALLPGKELAMRINSARNKPLEIATQLGTALRLSLQYNEWMSRYTSNGSGLLGNISIERQLMEQGLTELIDAIGAGERLVQSPVPLSWSRHTSRLLSIWSLTLPFVLVPMEGFLCIPTVGVICWGIFSIEEIAHILEDPFLRERYSLPLDEICSTIKHDVISQILR